jgi:D-alanyl-lipoteichoic acid acyltransferase DltB (MBOAT superfamily)
LSFSSLHFFLFLTLMVGACHALRHRWDARKNLLLAASYYFYACWDWRFLGLLVVITAVNFWTGRRIAAARDRRGRRAWLGVSLAVCLGILGYFKYAHFFVDSLVQLLQRLGLHADVALIDVLLPVGISFYTFQSLSYVLDIYRRVQQPTHDLRDFALFVAFFPTLLAGPVTRARDLLPQLAHEAAAKEGGVEQGLALVLRGLIKKVAFADVLARHMVDPAFAAPGEFSPVFLLLALYAYTFQMYMDVSGYTDIARGAAAMCGFELPRNFDRPYIATTVSNFWQRWHISVSSYFRDYIFYPMGGSRHGNAYLNLMVTFLVIGLWHGGSWNFLLYGALHGGMVCFDRWVRQGREAGRAGLPVLPTWLAVALTFHFIAFSRILFRSPDLQAASAYLQAMTNFSQHAAHWTPLSLLALATAALLHWAWPQTGRRLVAGVAALSPAWQGLCIAGLVYSLLAIAGGEAQFVYFGF